MVLQYVDLSQGGRVVELGFGPGHLQLEMQRRGINCIGIDESAQMCKIAHRRLTRVIPGKDLTLLRGLAEQLPLANGVADAVIATFPADYIFSDLVVEGCSRILRPGGEIVFLMGALPGGFSWFNLVLKFLSGESQLKFKSVLRPAIYLDRIKAHGFEIQAEAVAYKKDQLWLIRGHKV